MKQRNKRIRGSKRNAAGQIQRASAENIPGKSAHAFILDKCGKYGERCLEEFGGF
jgi:hypothetical protein